MAIRVSTLVTYDARGRMLLSNEPCAAARQPAPRLFLGRTAAGDVVRFGATVPDALAQRVDEILARQLPGEDLRLSPATLDAVRVMLAEQAPVGAEDGGPVYRFPHAITRPTGVVRLRLNNRDLIRDTFPWLFEEIADWQPCFAIVRDQAAVSICFSSRQGPFAAEAGVETLPDYRGRGFAPAVTAAWGSAIAASDRIPIYSTAWENLASQGVARRLGLIQFGADTTWT
jgi:hypothetical protein